MPCRRSADLEVRPTVIAIDSFVGGLGSPPYGHMIDRFVADLEVRPTVQRARQVWTNREPCDDTLIRSFPLNGRQVQSEPVDLSCLPISFSISVAGPSSASMVPSVNRSARASLLRIQIDRVAGWQFVAIHLDHRLSGAFDQFDGHAILAGGRQAARRRR